MCHGHNKQEIMLSAAMPQLLLDCFAYCTLEVWRREGARKLAELLDAFDTHCSVERIYSKQTCTRPFVSHHPAKASKLLLIFPHCPTTSQTVDHHTHHCHAVVSTQGEYLRLCPADTDGYHLALGNCPWHKFPLHTRQEAVHVMSCVRLRESRCKQTAGSEGIENLAKYVLHTQTHRHTDTYTDISNHRLTVANQLVNSSVVFRLGIGTEVNKRQHMEKRLRDV
eukprot:3372592-Amphidinium_carterae.1